MSSSVLLRAFVTKRLTAAAEEIFNVFEKTIIKYEEEASSSQQEIERLTGLLQEFMDQNKTDVPLPSVCKEEAPSELQKCEREPNIGTQQGDLGPRHIKEEEPELWADQQQEEPVGEFEQRSSVWHRNAGGGEQSKKVLFQTQIQNCEHEEELVEDQEAKGVQLIISPVVSMSSSQSLVQNEHVQDEREEDPPADQIQTDQSQTSFSIFWKSSKLPPLNSDHLCYVCNKSFSFSHHLINHALRMHSQDPSFICAVCGKALESSGNLYTHMDSHRGSRSCHMCGKQCISTTALTEHMASHAGVKLHRCHVCGKECSRKGDLKIHMRIHTGEKPFCCSYCGKSFTHSGHLRKHMRSHTGERPHHCDICGRRFLQRAHLKYHLGTHAKK
ncbi:uncharacterized protein KZ484_012129 isoform 1-T1 [Pholidichthys leucotaenia]